MSQVLDLCCELVRRASVTPDDAQCQDTIANYLTPSGYRTEWFKQGDVSNVLLSHGDPASGPTLMFLGHTDVVPVGADKSWRFPPFSAYEHDGMLYGRGTADMKGAVAAMVVALKRLVDEYPDHPGCLQLLLTSDEEGPATEGTCVVAAALKARGRAPDYCLVGEPSSHSVLGDNVRVGRRGSINARLQINGQQGHTAFGHLVDNPAHKLAGFLAVATRLVWDQGDELFPPTSLQVSSLQAGDLATNVTPATAEAKFNLRNGPASSANDLKKRIEDLLGDLEVSNYQLDWNVSARPFYTAGGELTAALAASITDILGHTPDMNTKGGTSDGRFIAPLGSQVAEFGLLNHSIHKVNEHVAVADLDLLMAVYFDVARRLLIC